jgi:hypothetical protein
MRSRFIFYTMALMLVIALGAALWTYEREHDQTPARAANIYSAPARSGQNTYSSSVVLSIDASKPSPLPRKAPALAPESLSLQFDRAKQLKPLYDRLASSPSMTPDAKYVMYRLLSACATRTDRKDGGDRHKRVTEQRKDLEILPDSNPDKARRLELYDQLTGRCAGLENLVTTGDELQRLLDDAALDGDARAKAAIIAQQLAQTMPAPSSPNAAARQQGLTITDDQLGTLQQAIASKDPDAIAIAGTVLSNSFRDMVLEVGPRHDDLNGPASRLAWTLVACEYGLDCGESSRQVQLACAFGGQCAARTVPDLAFFYEVSPYQAQLIDQYRDIFRRAIEANDWSGITFARRPNTSGSRWFFSNSPPTR